MTDPESGETTAVVPVAPRGEGVERVRVLFAEPASGLATRLAEAENHGEALEVGATEPLTRQAFALQTSQSCFPLAAPADEPATTTT